MAREFEKLNARAIAKAKEPGDYGDGAGLYLTINANGARSWKFEYSLAGRRREMGLGPIHTVSLDDARQAARAARSLVQQKIDPIDARKAAQAAGMQAAKSFADCAAEYIKAHAPEWTEKHAEQWTNTLAEYASPIFGDRPVAQIDTLTVLAALIPIWIEKTETAKRVRQRISLVLDYAKMAGYRAGDNPARWEGHLELALAEPGKIQKTENHPALQYAELPGFLPALRKEKGTAARALEFMMLTATRTNEVQGAILSEIEADGKAWAIPGERMKMDDDLRVPLCKRAREILAEMKAAPGRAKPYIFPGGKRNEPMSSNAMLALLKRMNSNPVQWRDKKSGRAITPHGMRSTFATYMQDVVGAPTDLIDASLAHAVKNKTTAAYQRGELFDRRREMIEAYEAYALSGIQAAMAAK